MYFIQVFLTTVLVVLTWPTASSDQNVGINRKHLKFIENSMNDEVKPCVDFYQYACGKFSENHEADKDKYTTAISKADYEVNMELMHYMYNTHMENKPEFVKNAREFFISCAYLQDYNVVNSFNWLEERENMTWALFESAEVDKDADEEEEEEEEEKEKTNEWVHTLGVFRRYGLNNIFVREDMLDMDTDASKRIINLHKHKSFDALTEEELKTLSETVFVMPNDEKPLLEYWDEISAFEELVIKLNEAVETEDEKLIKFEDLPLDWLKKYFQVIFQNDTLATDIEINLKDNVYLEALDALLQEYDDIFLRRYLEIRFIYSLWKSLEGFNDVQCMDTTRGFMPIAMDWIYEQMHPEIENEIPKITDMFNGIMKKINLTLHSDDNGLVPEKFLSNFDNIKLKISNIPRVDTVKTIESFYANLKLDGSDFYGNQLKLKNFYFTVDHATVSNEIDINVNEYFYGIVSYDAGASLDPYHVESSNLFVIPPGILRPPFYHWGYDDIYKLSGLGSLLANYVYFLPYYTDLSNKETQKIADVASIHTTLNVYVELASKSLTKKVILNGEKKSSTEIFLLNAAQYYCGGDEENRLNTLVQYLPEFADIFECKVNDFMKVFARLSNKKIDEDKE